MPNLVFNESLCKACKLCLFACPTKVLKLDTLRVNSHGFNPAILYNPAECIGCGSCAKICPDSVIAVYK